VRRAALINLARNVGLRYVGPLRARTRINSARRRLAPSILIAAARLAPKKYGDHIQHDVKGGITFPLIAAALDENLWLEVVVRGR